MLLRKGVEYGSANLGQYFLLHSLSITAYFMSHGLDCSCCNDNPKYSNIRVCYPVNTGNHHYTSKYDGMLL
jgi:hypothetical protein